MLFRRFLAIFGMLLLLAGCQKTLPAVQSTNEADNSSGRIAVIDLDEVAKRLGRADELATELSRQTAALNQQISQLQQAAQAKFLEAKNQETAPQTAAVGNEVIPTTDAGETQLKQLGVQLNGQLLNAKRTAQLKLAKHRETLFNKFREEVKPFALEVAKQRGLTVIITKREFLYSVGPSADITEEVIGKMATRTSVASRPAAIGAVNQRTPADRR
ncbi:MAG: Skp family chaperone for outer membrane protein [Pirellulaceae bacterium]|jgi:Skp family chaperone for outer membrane proteins